MSHTSLQTVVTDVNGFTICVNVAIVDNTVYETNETFTVSLSSNDSTLNITRDSAQVTIIDNDGKL